MKFTHLYAVSPLHMNLQVANFQRCEHAFHQCQASVKLQLALRLLLLTILQLYHLPPPLPLPVSNSSCLLTRCQPLYARCCTVLLYFSRYCTVRFKMFCFFFFFLATLCMACGILIPQSGIEPTTPSLGAQGLNHWTAREVP